ncbi:MAG TPA: transaldolase [Kofleriaceae bacterium]|nr:transaldolase [Kofleriaceae bacterium]
MQNGRSKLGTPISVVLTDVDGTLLTHDKILTERARSAVQRLHDKGIMFTITSGRPPFGMRHLVDPLGLTLPMAAFNGGAIVTPDLSVLDVRGLPEYLVPALIDMVLSHGLDVWLFRTRDWIVRDPKAPRVDRETFNIQTPPVVVSKFDDVLIDVVKIVGTSTNRASVVACEAAIEKAFGTQVFAARTNDMSLDITHPQANKGVVIERLGRLLKIPLERIAALGDQANDLAMLERAGLSIAMGNAPDELKSKARIVTTSHADEGFANAIEQYILPRAEPFGGPSVRPTAWLHRLGQSLWLDNITRDWLVNGTLARAIEELSLTGLTSNPTIYEHALKKSSAYDAAFAELARQGASSEDLFFELAIEDLKQAADMFRPIWDRSDGVDGWVSLEVSPLLAKDPVGTLAAAKALFTKAGRPNLMIKIPGTREGLIAVEEAIFLGIPINVTLLFSREHYLAAAEAFVRGIERRIEAGLKAEVASVASVFVSRWDNAVVGKVPEELRNTLGIAMAQRTYKAYRSLLASPRFQRIYNAGARPQRLLWASTGTKDPKASDVLYVSALTAQFTVITMPEATLKAVADHGKIVTLMRADGGMCEQQLAKLKAAGVDLYGLAEQLQIEGTQSFEKSWNQLMSFIATKAAPLQKPPPRATR